MSSPYSSHRGHGGHRGNYGSNHQFGERGPYFPPYRGRSGRGRLGPGGNRPGFLHQRARGGGGPPPRGGRSRGWNSHNHHHNHNQAYQQHDQSARGCLRSSPSPRKTHLHPRDYDHNPPSDRNIRRYSPGRDFRRDRTPNSRSRDGKAYKRSRSRSKSRSPKQRDLKRHRSIHLGESSHQSPVHRERRKTLEPDSVSVARSDDWGAPASPTDHAKEAGKYSEEETPAAATSQSSFRQQLNVVQRSKSFCHSEPTSLNPPQPEHSKKLQPDSTSPPSHFDGRHTSEDPVTKPEEEDKPKDKEERATATRRHSSSNSLYQELKRPRFHQQNESTNNPVQCEPSKPLQPGSISVTHSGATPKEDPRIRDKPKGREEDPTAAGSTAISIPSPSSDKTKVVQKSVDEHLDQLRANFEGKSRQGQLGSPSSPATSGPIQASVSSRPVIKTTKKVINRVSSFEAALTATTPKLGNKLKRVPSTPHTQPRAPAGTGELTARQRIMHNWEASSYEPQKAKIAELEENLKQMEANHREAIRKKSEDFEKWITQKEKLLTEKEKEKKQLNALLEQSKVDMADAVKQHEQREEAQAVLESTLAEHMATNHKTSKEKKGLEKKVTKLESQVEEQNKLVEELKLQLKNIQLDKKSQAEQHTSNLSEKEAEIEEKAIAVVDMHKKVARLEKQIEHHKSRADKLAEDKKVKTMAMREQTKKFKETEADLLEKIQVYEDQQKANNSQKLAMKKELKKIEKNSEGLEKLKEVTMERDNALEVLAELQLKLETYVSAVQEKKLELMEANSRCEEMEANLQNAVTKLNSAQKNDKDKKDMNKTIKQLQATLQEYEKRQFSQLSHINGLQKKIDDQDAKLKNVEENSACTIEEMSGMQRDLARKDVETKEAREARQLAEQEKARAEARLQNRDIEVDNLRKLKEELDAKVRQLEREVRCSDADDFEYMRTKVLNLENELTHFRSTHNRMKEEQLAMNTALRSKVELLEDENAKLKTDALKIRRENDLLKKKQGHDGGGAGRYQPEKTNRLASSSISSNSSTLATDSVWSSGPDIEVIQRMGSSVKRESLERMDAEFVFGGSSNESSNTIDTTTDQIIVKPPVNAFHMLPTSSVQSRSEDPLIPTTSVDIGGGKSITVIPPPPPTHRSTARASTRPAPVAQMSSSPVFRAASMQRMQPQSYADDSNEDEYVNVEDGNIVCSICHQYDPPLPVSGEGMNKPGTTKWVGCDCQRWFHCQCTKLTRHTKKFSCRSVKMKCLQHPPAPERRF